PLPPPSTLFPYTTLFRSRRARPGARVGTDSGLLRCRGLGLQRVLGLLHQAGKSDLIANREIAQDLAVERDVRGVQPFDEAAVAQDRKSTRLNSSHDQISY